MSEPINDGGPAFPWGEHGTHLGGLTMRDYFAAKAMAALIVRDKFRVGMAEPSEQQQAACLAYSFADRMIKARES